MWFMVAGSALGEGQRAGDTGRKQRTAFTSSGMGIKGDGDTRLHCEAGEGSCQEDTQRRGAYVL